MKKKQKHIIDQIKKHHFELRHLLIVFVVLVLSQMMITYIHKISLQRFLLETREGYQRDYINSLANMSATSLELLMEVTAGADLNDDEKRQVIQAFNIVLSQQLLQPHVEEAVLLLESRDRIVPIDDGTRLLDYLTGGVPVPASDSHRMAVARYREERESIRKTEQIVTITEGSQRFHVFVPFVLRGEYSGVFYLRANPAFGFVTNEILNSYNQTNIIFIALILFGFLGMFYISSYTVSERDEAQRLLYDARESKIKEEKEALFTKRIYHTHHKAEKVMGFIKEDLRELSTDNLDSVKYQVMKYANFISRVIYDMKWFDPPVQTIRSQLFSTNLNEVVTFMVEKLFKRTTRASDHLTFTLDFDSDLPAVQVNEFVVWEILEPLIQNCIDHSGRDRVTITVTTRHDKEQRKSRLVIEDNGTGIAGHLLDRNEQGVQMLFNEHVSTKKDHHNNGYGCYIAYELAKERCGWDIEAGNRDGGGAVFTITITHS
ncbi:sensor histidine kinase [bacterium]|nr:sensor histidine kinase [bacterium]